VELLARLSKKVEPFFFHNSQQRTATKHKQFHGTQIKTINFFFNNTPLVLATLRVRSFHIHERFFLKEVATSFLTTHFLKHLQYSSMAHLNNWCISFFNNTVLILATLLVSLKKRSIFSNFRQSRST